MADVNQLLRVLAVYCAATGYTESTVSTRFFGRGGRAKQLREGSDMGSYRVARMLARFSAEWPEGTSWPAEISRPVAQAAE